MADYQAQVQLEKEQEKEREKESKRLIMEESLSDITSSVTQSFNSMSRPISQLSQALKIQKGASLLNFQKRDSERSVVSISTGSTLIF